jgi:hypothetical protein
MHPHFPAGLIGNPGKFGKRLLLQTEMLILLIQSIMPGNLCRVFRDRLAGFLHLSDDHAGFNYAYCQQNKEKAVAQAVPDHDSRKTVSLKILSRVSGLSVFHALLASSGREPAVGRRSPVRRMALRERGFPAISAAPG